MDEVGVNSDGAIRFYPGWGALFAAFIGLMVCVGPLVTYTFGVFLIPISKEFAWTRGATALALTVHTVVLAVSMPFVGRLTDHLGARRVVVSGVVCVGLVVACLGLLRPSALMVYALFGVLGVVTAVVTMPPYTRVVCAWFTRRRGLALGIASSGVGIGIAIIPPVAQRLIAAFGWRGAYCALGLLSVVIALPPLILFFREPAPGEPTESSIAGLQRVAAPPSGDTLGQAARTRNFWLLIAVFMVSSAAVTGAGVHVVPLLTDAGLTAQHAATIAAALGIALLAGRLLSGVLMDRYFAPAVAIAFFLLAAVGMIVLALKATVVTGTVGTVLLGLGIGTEMNVMAYLTSRYFGMRSFTEISSWLFLSYAVGSAAGPTILALTFDRFGNYRLGLVAFSFVTLIAALLLGQLGAYRWATDARGDARPI